MLVHNPISWFIIEKTLGLSVDLYGMYRVVGVIHSLCCCRLIVVLRFLWFFNTFWKCQVSWGRQIYPASLGDGLGRKVCFEFWRKRRNWSGYIHNYYCWLGCHLQLFLSLVRLLFPIEKFSIQECIEMMGIEFCQHGWWQIFYTQKYNYKWLLNLLTVMLLYFHHARNQVSQILVCIKLQK